MTRKFVAGGVLGILLLAGAMHVVGQGAAAPSVREEAQRNFDDASNKLIRLAERIPAEKYTWRPGEGVRSVAEVFLHAAAGNFNIPARVGVPRPEGITLQGLETSTTDKAKIVELLKQAIEHARKGYTGLADVEKTSPWFGGRQATYREILFFLASHNHEHLGQMIAYARVNGVVPPWTEEAQQRQQQAPKKGQ